MRNVAKVYLAIVTLVCAACAPATTAFVQGHTRIVPPVTRLGSDTRLETITLFNDGGTRLVTIRDAAGKHFDVYFDHRINSPAPGAIYLYALPGKHGSVRVVDKREFERKLGIRE
jgi:hypothetical protein